MTGAPPSRSRTRRRPVWLAACAASGLLAGGVALAVGATTGDRSADSTALDLVEEARGLDAPTAIDFRPGDPGRIYVSEQSGLVRVVERGRPRPAPFVDIRDRVLSGGERGLLGFAFAPDHARSGILYLHYSARPRGDTRVVRVRARGDAVDLRSAETILRVRQPYENHKGGQLAFDSRGRLHVGLGDGGSAFDPDGRAQDLSTSLGKILRLESERKGRPRWQPIAYGLRNPWRFSFDRASGDLWIGDVGQDRMEEIDVIPATERGLVNFGWGRFEGTASNPRPQPLRPGGRLAGPVVAYGRGEGCSVIGGYVYRGRAIPSLQGRYVYGDLCSGRIWSLRRRGGRTDVRREPTELPLISSFGQDVAGELHAVSLDGRAFALRARGNRR